MRWGSNGLYKGMLTCVLIFATTSALDRHLLGATDGLVQTACAARTTGPATATRSRSIRHGITGGIFINAALFMHVLDCDRSCYSDPITRRVRRENNQSHINNCDVQTINDLLHTCTWTSTDSDGTQLYYYTFQYKYTA